VLAPFAQQIHEVADVRFADALGKIRYGHAASLQAGAGVRPMRNA
jgi:hypothetical protein